MLSRRTLVRLKMGNGTHLVEVVNVFRRGHRSGIAGHDKAEIITEATNLLEGRVLAERTHRGQAVPAWVWLNVLSHGDLRRIRQLRHGQFSDFAALTNAEEPLYGDFSAEMLRVEHERMAWRAATRTLADELLEAVHHDAGQLRLVQRAALIPLELELLSRTTSSLSPEELLSSVRSVLSA